MFLVGTIEVKREKVQKKQGKDFEDRWISGKGWSQLQENMCKPLMKNIEQLYLLVDQTCYINRWASPYTRKKKFQGQISLKLKILTWKSLSIINIIHWHHNHGKYNFSTEIGLTID